MRDHGQGWQYMEGGGRQVGHEAGRGAEGLRRGARGHQVIEKKKKCEGKEKRGEKSAGGQEDKGEPPFDNKEKWLLVRQSHKAHGGLRPGAGGGVGARSTTGGGGGAGHASLGAFLRSRIKQDGAHGAPARRRHTRPIHH